MLKIKELLRELQVLVETQIQINKSLKDLKEGLNPAIKTISLNTDKIGYVTSCLETNIYTKEQTIETINKECDYRQKYAEYKSRNADLLEMIEKYCKYISKYEVLDIFDKLDKEYVLTKITTEEE